MGVGDHILSLILIGCYRLGIAFRYGNFVYLIDDLLTVCLVCKTGPGIAPVVCLIQLYCCSLCGLPCIKLHGDGVRTDSILVVAVCPYLSYTYTGLFFTIRKFSIYSARCTIVSAISYCRCTEIFWYSYSHSPFVIIICNSCYLL